MSAEAKAGTPTVILQDGTVLQNYPYPSPYAQQYAPPGYPPYPFAPPGFAPPGFAPPGFAPPYAPPPMPLPTPFPPAPAPAATPSDATPAPAPADSHQAHAQLLQSHVSQLELQLRAQLQAAARSESQRCEAVALHAALQHDLSVAQAEVGRLSAQLAHIAGHSEEQAAQLGEVAERESDLVAEARRGALERSLLQVLAATLEAEAVDSGTRAAAALAQNRQLLSEMQARSHARPPVRPRAAVPCFGAACACVDVCARCVRRPHPPTSRARRCPT